jgi:hypothetical protein
MYSSILKIIMKSNVVVMEAPFHVNPLTWLLQTLLAYHILQHSFPKFFKLVKIAIVQVLGSMEDERTFSTISLMKCKLKEHFNEHLNTIVGIIKLFIIWIFPHMTHVLKIGKNKSPSGHWIKLFYWDLGGVYCSNSFNSEPFSMMSLSMAKVESFCHL